MTATWIISPYFFSIRSRIGNMLSNFSPFVFLTYCCECWEQLNRNIIHLSLLWMATSALRIFTKGHLKPSLPKSSMFRNSKCSKHSVINQFSLGQLLRSKHGQMLRTRKLVRCSLSKMLSNVSIKNRLAYRSLLTKPDYCYGTFYNVTKI